MTSDIVIAVPQGRSPTAQERLYKNLLTHYSKISRPVKNQNHPINLSFSFELIKVHDVVSGSVVYDFNFSFCMYTCTNINLALWHAHAVLNKFEVWVCGEIVSSSFYICERVRGAVYDKQLLRLAIQFCDIDLCFSSFLRLGVY